MFVRNVNKPIRSSLPFTSMLGKYTYSVCVLVSGEEEGCTVFQRQILHWNQLYVCPLFDDWAGIAQPVQRLAMAWRPGDWIPVGTRFSMPVQTGPGAHSASYTMGTGSFRGVKHPGRGVEHPPPPQSSTDVKRVELPIWAFMTCCRVNFTFTLFDYPPLSPCRYACSLRRQDVVPYRWNLRNIFHWPHWMTSVKMCKYGIDVTYGKNEITITCSHAHILTF
jgi:hypothetical protein